VLPKRFQIESDRELFKSQLRVDEIQIGKPNPLTVMKINEEKFQN
jgi:hypothetical protein